MTDRQRRELEYHRSRAAEHEYLLTQPIAYDILKGDRWWNNGWAMYGVLNRIDVRGKRVLVVGCGFGTDAIRIAKLGAEVYAFDLSPESVAMSRTLGEREGVAVTFEEMAAESLEYPDGFFDVVVARDILHHVEIPRSMSEMRRVSKPGSVAVINEIYSHTWTEAVRRSWLVERVLYGKLKRMIYGDDVYITEDERKLTENDIRAIADVLHIERRTYFNLFVMRIIPDRVRRINQVDQLLLSALGPIGRYVAGRILIVGRFGNVSGTR